MRAIDTCAYRDTHLTMTLTAAHWLGRNNLERGSGRSSAASGSAVRPMQLVEWVTERLLMPQVNHVYMHSWFYARLKERKILYLHLLYKIIDSSA
jgi:hypothetical protein